MAFAGCRSWYSSLTLVAERQVTVLHRWAPLPSDRWSDLRDALQCHLAFARLDVGHDQISISLSEDLGLLTCLMRFPVPPTTTLIPVEVRHVESRFGMSFSHGLRFRTVDASDARDGLVFWYMSRDREEILRLVGAAGFTLS